MRLKNDLYFEELEIKRKEKLLDYRQALVKKQKNNNAKIKTKLKRNGIQIDALA